MSDSYIEINKALDVLSGLLQSQSKVLGFEGLTVTETFVRPDLDCIADFSNADENADESVFQLSASIIKNWIAQKPHITHIDFVLEERNA